MRWYYITNASTKAYCAGKVMYYDAELDLMRFGDKSFSPDRIWSFWEQDGKLAIKNFNGDYIGTAGTGTGGATQFGKSEEANPIYTIQSAYGFFTIKDSNVELHAQEAGAGISISRLKVLTASSGVIDDVYYDFLARGTLSVRKAFVKTKYLTVFLDTGARFSYQQEQTRHFFSAGPKIGFVFNFMPDAVKK